jgi:Ran-binding protein 1
MADASTEPKLAQTETELATKPLHGDEKAAEAPKETSDTPATV